jgi:hypothetical protein
MRWHVRVYTITVSASSFIAANAWVHASAGAIGSKWPGSVASTAVNAWVHAVAGAIGIKWPVLANPTLLAQSAQTCQSSQRSIVDEHTVCMTEQSVYCHAFVAGWQAAGQQVCVDTARFRP